MFLITAKNTAIFKQTKKEFNGHYPAGYICFLVLGVMLGVMNNANHFIISYTIFESSFFINSSYSIYLSNFSYFKTKISEKTNI